MLVLALVLGVGAVSAEELALGTVYEVIQDDENLNSFEALVEAGALADNLDRDGPFTVFAPTDAAISAFELERDDTDATLTQVMLYHVINGNYSGPEIANLKSLPTLLGEHVNFSVRQGNIMINDSTMIVTRDIEAANGVVHVVDAVLVPPASSLSISTEGSPDLSLAEVLANDGRFGTFLSLIETAGLMEILENENDVYTIFAPTDAAFEATSEDFLEQWLADPEGELNTILSYHIVTDQLSINQIANDDYLPTMEGRAIAVTTDEDLKVYVNGREIVTANIRASNGVIHAVNEVVLP
jgi:uncharacterized surface protein with fasciclin (FAS1) repeats